MSVFSIADLHLSASVNKPMDKFGARWTDHTAKIEKNWRKIVSEEDTIVLPGDISWGISLEEALEDFRFIDSLPGQKLIGKGNHDYWWSTITKMTAFLAENHISSIRFLYNNAYEVEDYIICGTRGWYVEERMQGDLEGADYQKIINRENIRLEMCIKDAESLQKDSGKPILVYFHFPPVFRDFVCREFVDTLLAHGIHHCYFGHIHGVYNIPRTVIHQGITMTLVSADFLNFVPMITMPLDFDEYE